MGNTLPGNSPPSKQRAKDIIKSTQHTFDKLKRDLQDKELLIEEKNREILRLRMANEEANMRIGGRVNASAYKMASDMAGSLDPEQRDQLIQELSLLVDELRMELMKVKGNLFNQISKNQNFESKRQY